MEYILLIISTILVNNIVFAQTLGICPFLGVSSKISSSVGMGAAVVFVITIATLITFLINQYILVPLHLDAFLQTLVFILVIAALVQMVEIILKKVSPSLYSALGIFLPLITTNCAVLGVALLVIQKEYNALSADQKKLVKNYDKLEEAAASLEKLKKEEEDKEKAQEIIDRLDHTVNLVIHCTVLLTLISQLISSQTVLLIRSARSADCF